MMENGEIRKLKNGIEIYFDHDNYGNRRYSAIDPDGYLGRTRFGESWDYAGVNGILAAIRNYCKGNNIR